MLRYVSRRLWQSALTIVGVMVITFLLFRVISGDVAAANLGQKATETEKAAWRHRHGYDLPPLLNRHRQLFIEDLAGGQGQLAVRDPPGSNAADALSLILSDAPGRAAAVRPDGKKALNVLMGRYVWFLSAGTPIEELTDGRPMVVKPRARPAEAAATSAPSASAPSSSSAPATEPATAPAGAAWGQAAPADESEPAVPPGPPLPLLEFTLSDDSTVTVDLTGVKNCQELMVRINSHALNGGRLQASISPWGPGQLFRSQFFRHLVTSVTFQARSLKDNRKLIDIIAERGPASLSLQVPAFVLEWLLGLVVASFVAYYRGRLIDKVGVFLSVLGMCIPFLAFMIYGQWAMFEISPRHAFGTLYRANVYVPIAIMVVAGLGSQVRFYRTIILDETNRDYVRTAVAKGVPLTSVLFKHVLKNCMLPILTSLILSIPFLILGGLLVESYFGIPGLGDLMLTSIQDRNEPIMNGLVFLMALVYTLGVLVTDLCYAIFDPRIRLQ